jgi:pilus assembly protein FimV
VKKKVIVQAPPPAPEPSFFDEILDSPLMLALGAGLLLLLGGAGVYLSRRRNSTSDFQDSSLLTESSLKSNSLFASTGGQSVDTNNSVFNSSFAPSASQLDTNEVDPVAEADVYIAYGRDAQAEEILKEALRTQPERNAVRVKLLEIYAHRKDLRSFESMAGELFSLTKGKGEEWEQVAALGVTIDPKNPLYSGAKPLDANTVQGDRLSTPTEQLDELDLAALLNTTRGAEPSEPEEQPVVESPPPKPAAPPAQVAAPVIPTPAPPAPPAAQPEKLAALDETSTGLDFEFDLAGLGIQEVKLPNAEPAPAPQAAPAVPAMDFDLQMPAPSAPPKTESANGLANHAPLEMEVPPSLPQAAPAPQPQAFDMSGISLDLDTVGGNSIMTVDDADAGQSNANEMATKLDLAVAYQEIGDKEGARELLDEVIRGGSGEQVQKAESLLQKMA